MEIRSSLEMQPTFQLEIPVAPQEAMRRIREVIEAQQLQPLVTSAGNCVDFQISPEDQRFWSPHLSIQLNHEDSTLFGRFSPRPEIWTMFMAIYAITAVCIFAAGIYGYVQWFLGSSPWAIIFVPLGIVLIGTLHVASKIGQRLSCDQMQYLRNRLDEVLSAAFDESIDLTGKT